MTIAEVIASLPSLHLLLRTQRLMNTFWINKDRGETREREKEKWKEREGEKSGEKAREKRKREGLVFSSAR